MSWLLMLACSGPTEPTPEAAPAPQATPTADEVLARHAGVTRQCEMLARESYAFDWSATTNDGHSKERVERIRYQGKPGKSFTRIHQHIEPIKRFVAFGRAEDGHAWSAGENAIQTELPEEVVASMQAQLDPTPICNWEARWPVRVMVGPTTFQEFPAWELELVWPDGVGTHMWFHRESGLLMGSRSKAGGAESTTTLTDYGEVPCEACTGPVLWPRKETGERLQEPLKISTVQTLERLVIDDPAWKPIGPVEVSKVLTAAAAEVAENPPAPE